MTRPQQQFLRFYLEPDMVAMLPVMQLSEVLTIALGEIVPIPHLPPWVMGVYNWRGEILWMVDLGALLGLTPWHQQMASTRSYYRALILNGAISVKQTEKVYRGQNSNQMLGLVVTRVEDIEWCNTDELQSPPAASVSTQLIAYLRGFWVKPSGDVVVALDGQSIVAKMRSS
ncbi:MAG: chemotaxis protein CheW [Snowella sp.]|nr:chemotaxis protein CheW [Snowella sp.]